MKDMGYTKICVFGLLKVSLCFIPTVKENDSHETNIPIGHGANEDDGFEIFLHQVKLHIAKRRRYFGLL